MALDKNAELLGCVPLFEGLAPEQLLAIVIKETRRFSKPVPRSSQVARRGRPAI